MSHRRALRRLLVPLLLAPLLATALVLVSAPAHAGRVGPEYFGMLGDWANKTPTIKLGAANLTSQTYWFDIERTEGRYDFTRARANVDAARAKGARPMAVIGGTPTFQADLTLVPRIGANFYARMPDLTAWRAYTRALAVEFGTTIDYQVWPEANIVSNWGGTPQQMALLTVEAAKSIRAVAPGARIVSPAMALRLSGQQSWMKNYLGSKVDGVPVGNYLSAVAIDPYPLETGTPEQMAGLVRFAKSVLVDTRTAKPLWINEVNYGIASGGTGGDFTLAPRMQRAWLIRTYALAAGLHVARVDWFYWAHAGAVPMLNADGTLAPAAYALGRAQSWLTGTKVTGCSVKNRVYTCTAVTGTGYRRIYWRTGGTSTLRTPTSTTGWQSVDGRKISRRGTFALKLTAYPVVVYSKR